MKSKQSKEFSEQGKVKWDVYAEYAKTSNLVAVAIYVVTLLGAQTAQIGMSRFCLLPIMARRQRIHVYIAAAAWICSVVTAVAAKIYEVSKNSVR